MSYFDHTTSAPSRGQEFVAIAVLESSPREYVNVDVEVLRNLPFVYKWATMTLMPSDIVIGHARPRLIRMSVQRDMLELYPNDSRRALWHVLGSMFPSEDLILGKVRNLPHSASRLDVTRGPVSVNNIGPKEFLGPSSAPDSDYPLDEQGRKFVSHFVNSSRADYTTVAIQALIAAAELWELVCGNDSGYQGPNLLHQLDEARDEYMPGHVQSRVRERAFGDISKRIVGLTEQLVHSAMVGRTALHAFENLRRNLAKTDRNEDGADEDGDAIGVISGYQVMSVFGDAVALRLAAASCESALSAAIEGMSDLVEMTRETLGVAYNTHNVPEFSYCLERCQAAAGVLRLAAENTYYMGSLLLGRFLEKRATRESEGESPSERKEELPPLMWQPQLWKLQVATSVTLCSKAGRATATVDMAGYPENIPWTACVGVFPSSKWDDRYMCIAVTVAPEHAGSTEARELTDEELSLTQELNTWQRRNSPTSRTIGAELGIEQSSGTGADGPGYAKVIFYAIHQAIGRNNQ